MRLPIDRKFLTLIAATLLAGGWQSAFALSVDFEYDIDRPGSDYLNFDLQAANPALCFAQCERDNRCKAWTYVKPEVQGALPRCWLKSSVPAPVRANYAVSGMRTGQLSGSLPQPVGPVSFAGNWKATDFDSMALTQSGNRVGGRYTGKGGGTFDGTVNGRVWKGNYYHHDGRSGTITVELTADGNGFKGTYETIGFSGNVSGQRAN